MSLRGKRVSTLLCAILCAAWCAESAAAAEMPVTIIPREHVLTERARRWAVLIGVDTYEADAGIAPLKCRSRDMKRLAEALTGPTGAFAPENVLLITDDATDPLKKPSRSNIVRLAPDWLTKAKEEDEVFVAFSGYGLVKDGAAYLLPRDAAPDDPGATALALDAISQWLAACKAARKVLALDVWRTGVGAEGAAAENVWRRPDLGRGVTGIVSAGADGKSHEDDLPASSAGNGPGAFVLHLAEAAQGRGDANDDGRVDVDEAWRHARARPRLEGVRLWPSATRAVGGDGRMTIGYGPRSVDIDLGDGVTMQLVYIPPGEFMIGSPANEMRRLADENPQHPVSITRGFYMGVHEVTQEQYEAVAGRNPAQSKGAQNPVECISWEQASEFCETLSARLGMSFRLPTEAEWEYACRAGTTTPFSFGETISTDQANYDGDYTYGSGQKGAHLKKSVAVGGFPPNAFGLYDMHGNVWEWCRDWHEKDYYATSPQKDPEGPGRARYRVLRGGCWGSPPWLCRSAARGGIFPKFMASNVGFRVAARPSPEE